MEDEGHKVVPPEHAAQYWAPCKEAPAMAAEAGIYKDCFGANGVEPVKLSGYFHLTPYAKWSSRCVHGKHMACTSNPSCAVIAAHAPTQQNHVVFVKSMQGPASCRCNSQG